MAMQPYRVLGAAEIDAARSDALGALGAWAEAWLDRGTSAELELRCEAAPRSGGTGPADAPRWLTCHGASGTVWACDTEVAALQQWLFGEPRGAEGSTSYRVARRALFALMQGLAGAQDGAQALQTDGAPPELRQAGRAPIALFIESPGVRACLYIETPAPAARHAAHPRREPPASARAGVGKQSVTVEAWLGEAELELGALRTLAVGDVLRLDRRIDDGPVLKLSGTALPCTAQLGVQGGKIAVELARR
jgi:flagellar motor switch/type III secretory pathway protein FliN